MRVINEDFMEDVGPGPRLEGCRLQVGRGYWREAYQKGEQLKEGKEKVNVVYCGNRIESHLARTENRSKDQILTGPVWMVIRSVHLREF